MKHLVRILLALVATGLESSPAPGSGSTRGAARLVVLPGEFEPVDRLLVVWDDTLAEFLAAVIAGARRHVGITILVAPDHPRDSLDDHLRRIRAESSRLGRRSAHRIHVVRLPVDTIWIRDFGPLVVRNADGTRTLVDFEYFDGGVGDIVPAALGRLWPGFSVRSVAVELEGGNVLSDGRGRCITTAGYVDATTIASSLPITASRVRWTLRRVLGCKTVYIVPPLHGEETGHVDMFATITGPGEVVVGSYTREDDLLNAERLDRTAARLRAAGFVVRRVPMPRNDDGRYRSYTNALAVNGAVLVPVYPDADDREAEALAVFRDAYPGREIVSIDASRVIQLDGAVHCATMTIPSVPRARRSERSRRRRRP